MVAKLRLLIASVARGFGVRKSFIESEGEEGEKIHAPRLINFSNSNNKCE